jgi:hypothetical protein
MSPEFSNRVQESARAREFVRKFYNDRSNRRRTTVSGTLCPPFSTLSFTRSSASSAFRNQRKKKCTAYPWLRRLRINFRWCRPESVVSNAKSSPRSIARSISMRNSLPARKAAASGEKGETPAAMRSALMKFLQSAKCGRNSRAKVVLPTPFGPAMI